MKERKRVYKRRRNAAEKIVSRCGETWIEDGGGKLLAAVSGGADSTALLRALTMAGVPFEAVHCNFNLRGAESIRDRDFVKSLCEKFGVTLHIFEFDTLKEQKKGESLEMTCRRLRYDKFRQLRDERHFSRIALAHNADDNIETFLLNALRGSGINGLKGMQTDTGELLRPLLRFHRTEILEFLKEINQDYITDSSNLSSDYRRNFLRNEVLPLIESRWSGAAKALTKTIEIIEREAKIINAEILEAIGDDPTFLPRESVFKFPDSQSLIYRFIAPHGGTPTIAAEIADSLSKSNIGKQWRLSDTAIAVSTKTGLQIIENETAEPLLPGEGAVWKQINMTEGNIDFKNVDNTIAYLPYPPENYKFLFAGPNMKIRGIGMKGRQSVWKILKDAGIPAVERTRKVVLTDAATGEVIWIPGLKRSSTQLLTGEEEIIYSVTLDKE